MVNPEVNRLSLKIAGPAGEGIMSAGHVFAKCCSRGGLYVVTENERPSLIRGGHNQFMIRAEAEPINSHINLVNVLLALDKQSALMHASELSYKGAIIYDKEDFELTPDMLGRHDLRLIGVPMRTIIKDIGAGKIVENAIAMGAAFGLLGYDLDILLKILKEEYGKHPEALAADIKAAQAGYAAARECTMQEPFTNTLKKVKAPKRMLINGLQAFNLGALKAGVSFLSQYPMTPSSGVIAGLAKAAEAHHIAIVQTEDEISSLNMALGASYAGVRALTATSGGGYALMNEALSLAGVTETGVVICLVSRGNPGTGLPTRTEQSDLMFVLNAGHGEFPHIVIAPSDPASAYVEAQRAFNLADKYQTPVTVLFDRHNAETYHTYEALPADLPIERGERFMVDEDVHGARRYEWNDNNGVSKVVIPSNKNGRFVASGNEHDPTGLMNDERETRTRMMQKRMRKLGAARAELPGPVLDGEEDADVTFVSWGSTLPIIKDARKFLEEKNISSSHLHLTYMNPFHGEEVAAILRKVKNPVLIENNATGQLGQLIRMHTGINIDRRMLQFDGWPFAPEEIAHRAEVGRW